MSERTVVGLTPWLPWPLSRWPSWTEPVRAERLAAMRIALAGFLLLDQFLTYLPNLESFFGRDSLGYQVSATTVRTWLREAGIPVILVELTNPWNPEFDRNLAGVQAVLARVAAEAGGVGGG